MMHPTTKMPVLGRNISRSSLIRAGTWVVWCLLIVWVVGQPGFGNSSKFNYLFALAVCISTAPLFINKDLFHPLNLFFVWQALFLIDCWKKYAVMGSLTYAPGLDYAETTYWLNRALFVFITWYVFLIAGHTIGSRCMLRKTPAVLRPRVTAGLYTGWLLAGTAFTAFALSVLHVGGLSAMWSAMADRVEAYAGQNHLRLAVQLGGVAAALFLFRRQFLLSAILIVITMCATAMYGTRLQVVAGLLIPFVIAVHYRVRPLTLMPTMILAGVTLIFVVWWGRVRTSAELHGMQYENLQSILFKAADAASLADNLAAMLWGLHNGLVHFQYGKTLINALLGAVPRFLWPDKPPSNAGHVLGHELFGADFLTSLPPGPYGIAYFNFGWLGVVLMAVSIGFVIGFYYSWFRSRVRSHQPARVAVLLYPFLVMNLFHIIDGEPLIASVALIMGTLFCRGVADRLSARQRHGSSRVGPRAAQPRAVSGEGAGRRSVPSRAEVRRAPTRPCPY